MKFLLITEEELDGLVHPYQFMFDDTVESDTYYAVKERGFVDVPIKE
jgi:hypothetical protein